MMKRTIFRSVLTAVALLGFAIVNVNAQQNIQFTQYIFNSLSVNPAYAGYKEEWFGQMGLRAQWMGIEDAPKTGQVSIDGLIDPETKRMGIGLQITSDQLGPQSANSAYVNYSYRLQLNDEGSSCLAFGLGVGVSQYGLDYSKLSAIDGTDSYVSQGTTHSFIPDARFGIYYSSSKVYIGASMMDIFADFDFASKIMGNETDNAAVIKHDKHFYLIAGTVLGLNEDIKIRPSILVKEDFKGPTSLDINSMFIFRDKFWIGGSYRQGLKLWEKDYSKNQSLSETNSVSAVAQLFLNDNLRLGYSYDYNLNELSKIQNGSHEITLGITFPKRIFRSLSPRYF
ncbi:PorP/SprF family type IX secretion system membrane protein [Desertivirga brevis]|uniref:PorP/SprF family type IX secretion system membrane protein n=1 Tax=Desertivirga brevis TaxID=2810310 RepID=UPI001F6021D3|nr:type IX secretion system membrane protein PorP/SprF [Pedobacter sp. SYSU D00873]